MAGRQPDHEDQQRLAGNKRGALIVAMRETAAMSPMDGLAYLDGLLNALATADEGKAEATLGYKEAFEVQKRLLECQDEARALQEKAEDCLVRMKLAAKTAEEAWNEGKHLEGFEAAYLAMKVAREKEGLLKEREILTKKLELARLDRELVLGMNVR
ncbi:hypothetical protein CFC21_107209 [Triticum aestivum]|uniref:Uncharacterized protein n=2 Tax=Triticum aestivum TaxID=4565 RepID=A0A9R1NAD2_WHEAT|nr:uncharacterized protein LOC120968371 [Aegilops tauschii subsp. strangulata]XP_044441842.1 uncharacterized protein LOC123168042 [Triticum aestivum]KAF7106482.1 hypothetical protein CFC21_107209 [Triticum aestivum]